jgi:hypothetical protein
VGLGGEVDDRLCARPGLRDRLRVADVALEELDVSAVKVRPVAGVGELVEDADLVAGRSEALGEVRTDEPGAAGDEHAHREKG